MVGVQVQRRSESISVHALKMSHSDKLSLHFTAALGSSKLVQQLGNIYENVVMWGHFIYIIYIIYNTIYNIYYIIYIIYYII